MQEKASGAPSPIGQEQGRNFLVSRIELNYDKGIGHGHQNTLDFYTSEKKPVIKRPTNKTAIPDRKHAFHYMEFFSQKAFEFIKKEGIIGKQQAKIMDYLAKTQQPLTDFEIHKGTGININAVTPRRGELLKLHRIIEFKCDKVNTSGREASAWGLITFVLPPQEWDTDHFPKSELFRRGWTDKEIKTKLKKPDKFADNPYNCDWSPMKLYEKQWVFRAERELYRESLKLKKKGARA